MKKLERKYVSTEHIVCVEIICDLCGKSNKGDDWNGNFTVGEVTVSFQKK